MTKVEAERLKVMIYAGNSELTAGDSKYLIDLVNNIDLDKFDVTIYSDRNFTFEQRIKQWLKVPISVKYIDTRPTLFENPKWGKSEGLKKYFGKIMDVNLGGRSLDRYFIYLFKLITFQSIRDDIHNVVVFYRLFKTNRDVDIFHVNNGGYPGKKAALIAIILAHLFGINKIIMSIHNEPQIRQWYAVLQHVIDYCVAKWCDTTIAASQVIQEELVKRRGFFPDKVRTIYCGLEDRTVMSPHDIWQKRKEMGLTAEQNVLLICGNLEEERKGHIPLFHALAEVKKQYADIVLLIVGEGTAKRTAYLKATVAELGIEDNVNFLGWRADIHELNSIADIAIVPSLYNEATPYTIKEANRANTPVITTSIGGCSEAFGDNKAGIVVSPNNISELAAAMLTLLNDKSLREEMGNSGRNIFLKRFLLCNIVKDHEKVYMQ